ncbi:hypothetical protein VZ95_03390, partial [Elstera litoralis]
MIATGIGGMEIFFARTPWGLRLRRASFVVTLLVKAPLYGGLVLALEYSKLGERVAHFFGFIRVVDPRDIYEPLTMLSIFFLVLLRRSVHRSYADQSDHGARHARALRDGLLPPPRLE